MDLITLLGHCLVSDNSVRLRADMAIRNTPNSIILPQLLPILISDGVVDVSIKVLAFTIIKTRIKSNWFIRDPESKNFIDPSIKLDIKSHMGRLLIEIVDPFNEILLINQLMDNINLIMSYEIGEEKLETSLQTMLIQIGSKLSQNQSQNSCQERDFYLNILVIQSIVKSNKFSIDSLPLINEIMRIFNPWYKFGIENNFNCSNQSHLDKIKYNLFKLYQYLTIMTIPEAICNENDLQYWTNCIIDSFKGLNNKISKWGLKIILNIFKKVSNSKNSKLEIQFINYLSNQLSCEIIFKILSNNLNDLCQDGKVSDQFTQLLMISVLNQNTYQQLKPHLEPIFNTLIIPNMTITHDEIDEFEDDPIAFINRLNNDSDTIFQQFIKLLLNHDNELKDPIFELMKNLIQSGIDSSINCGLNILTCLLQWISNDQLNLMIQLILDINSNIQTNDRLWLKCSIYEILTYVSNTGLEILINDQIPLPLLISSLKLLIFKKMDYKVVEIMSILLQISSSYPLEIIYELIDLIVLHHPNEIQPFNLDLIDKLTENFLSIYQNGENESNNNVDNIEQMVNIMNNFVTIVISINDPNSFELINERVLKVVEIIMSNGLLDILAEGMELLETINYMTKKVMNLELVLTSFQNFGIEYPDLYQIYFESVFQYGDGDDLKRMNETIFWIYQEQLHIDDFELNEIILSILCQMVIHPLVNSNDELSNEVITRTLQTSFELIDEKERFFENKLVLRCVLGSMIHKMGLISKLFGTQIKMVLNSLDILINKRQWMTVFDLRLGILALCSLSKSELLDNGELKSRTMGMIMGMVNRLEPAISHRMELMKLEKGVQQSSSTTTTTTTTTPPPLMEEVEITFDEEYDEINMETRIDSLNVVDIVRTTLNI